MPVLSYHPRARRSWAFVLPTIAVLVASSFSGSGTPTAHGSDLFLVTVGCALTGIAWQLLDRRDLVDRWAYFALLFTFTATVLFALGWTSEVTFFSDGLAVGLSAVLTGGVFTEQWLRFS